MGKVTGKMDLLVNMLMEIENGIRMENVIGKMDLLLSGLMGAKNGFE